MVMKISIVLILPFIWVSFFVFQNYSWRYLPMTIIGFFTPYLFLISYLFWYDRLDLLGSEWSMFQQQIFQTPHIHGVFNIIIFSLLAFFFLSSLAKIIPETGSKIISIRRKISLSLWLMFFTIYPLMFYPSSTAHNLYLIPLSGLLGYYLRVVKNRRMLVDILFTIFIILFPCY